MNVERTIDGLRDAFAPARAETIGLVPTMGALHEGHLALLRAARAENETVVMSLFVNPAQFAETGDLAAYPRDEERDLELARAAGVDLVFAPSAEEMYPPGFQTWVDVTELGSILEGRFRPGHFRGVATVVLKLLHDRPPHARVLRPEGRAAGRGDPKDDSRPRARGRARASSRRCATPTASRSRHATRCSRRTSASRRPRAAPRPRHARSRGRARAAPRASNGLEIDYVEVADFDPPVLAGAVRVGSTRLIDNVVLEGGTQ